MENATDANSVSANSIDSNTRLCRHCGGEVALRNPTGNCDHLYWPDMLTTEAKIANGFRLTTRRHWVRCDIEIE